MVDERENQDLEERFEQFLIEVDEDSDDPLFAGGQGRSAEDIEKSHDGLRVTVVFVVLAVLVWLVATGWATGWALSKN